MNQKHIFKKLAIVGVASLTLSAVSINTTTQIEAARTTHVNHKYSKSTIAKAKKRYLKAKKAYNSAKSAENKLKRQLKLAKSLNVSEADIEDAEADVTLKESALDNAETSLKWAKVRTNKTSSATSSSSSQLQKAKDELTNANKKLAVAKSNLNNLSNKPSKVINIGQSQLINFSNSADRNFYASSVKNRSYNNNSSNKNRLSAISKSIYKFNRVNYTSAPNDGYTVDLNNLTNSQYQELNRFALRALNAARRSVGSSDLVLSQSAFQMSKDVANEYKKDNWDYFADHDMNALTNVSNKFGIRNWKGTNTIENMQGKNIVTYKNDPYSGLPGGLEHSINSKNPYILSMKDAKTLIYEAMELLLFNGHEWAHAR
ncbi:SEC10/PgrA surface exclusion domain-containing protein [Lactobacillus crispatus]|uniref:SEC10/PgrA surface exclusion domain-containing protein n=1 Tax=Lactobacillus crispatus TaxID=47770 RepID=UPI0016694CF3|nr:SEC10/PgrA surface exclusion domain-containing protein [Lactobacillus crispatus]MBD0968209.1 SEC10/PgrA surface exclusion domain-containing protein [Lactobacillus crispatus]